MKKAPAALPLRSSSSGTMRWLTVAPKPPSQKVKEPNQNLKGFQRDWWDPAPSVSHWFLKLFATLAQKCFHSSIKNLCDHISKFWVRVWSAGECVPTPHPKWHHIWVAWLPSSQNASSFGVGTTQDSTTGTKEVQTQVTAVTDFSLLAQKHENALISRTLFSTFGPKSGKGTLGLDFFGSEKRKNKKQKVKSTIGLDFRRR